MLMKEIFVARKALAACLIKEDQVGVPQRGLH
jgi:hypothetical protein